MRWQKTGRTVKANGESTTVYDSVPARYTIESRKRAIKHANGVGYWMHTTYFLTDGTGWEKEFYSLKDAKDAAEKMEVAK